MTWFSFSAEGNCCEEGNILSWERDLAASRARAGSSLATGEVLVPATEVTAHLPSGLKWKKGNLAREEGKKKSMQQRGGNVRPKAKMWVVMGILERKWLEKQRNLSNGEMD